MRLIENNTRSIQRRNPRHATQNPRIATKKMMIEAAQPILLTTLRWCDLYRLSWTLCLACEALYAVLLSSWIRLLFRERMTWSISPVEHGHRADADADAVPGADVPVDSNIGSVYSQLFGRFHRPPDVMALVFIHNLTFLLKIRIYRQNYLTPF